MEKKSSIQLKVNITQTYLIFRDRNDYTHEVSKQVPKRTVILIQTSTLKQK
jgi:hypothetical protein